MRTTRRHDDLTSRWLVLSTVGLCSLAVYLFELTRVLWLPSYYDIPHLDIPKIVGTSTATLQWFASTAFLLWVLYLVAFFAASSLRSRRSALVVIGMGAVLGISLLPMFPGAAADVYAYIAEADVVLKYHGNPFIQPVSAFAGHPLLPFLDYPNETTHYGPLWLVVGVALRFLTAGNLLASILAFKASALAFLLATAWLVFVTARHKHPETAVRGALLVAWNPQLLFEVAGNAHNDIAMVFLVALAFYLHSRGSRRSAVAALIGACLVKYVAVVFVPLFLLVYLRQAGPWRRWILSVTLDFVGLTLLGAALVEIVTYQGTIGILQKLSEWFTTSVSAAVYYQLVQSLPSHEAADLVNNASKLLFVLAYLAIAIYLWLKPRAFLGSSLLVILIFMAVATTWFQPWYTVWAIPLAALVGTPIAISALGGMTIGGFLIHVIMGFAWRLDWNHGSWVVINAAGAAGMWMPVLVLVAGAALLVRYLPGIATAIEEPALPAETAKHG